MTERPAGRPVEENVMEGWEIRRMKPEDAAQAALLEQEVFPDPWSAESLADMLANPRAIVIAAVRNGELAGYCSASTVLDEGEILRIAVDGRFRGQNIGSALLKAALDAVPEAAVWYLEVREHNEAARGLYRKFGFAETGRRKRYYHHPEEDAVLMQLRTG